MQCLPIPKSDDELGQSTYTYRITISAGQTEIRDFNRTTIVHEQITRLQVAMQYPPLVTVRDGGEEL
ncbi:hypothetical protein PHLCEN_2v5347 [Hermanssonia centrifuga]|uniref:Uncharacterized protein n=1 Tax=Hermanssonia centrifuga TaxID=98765 RepID=A0A2R6P5J4_9APHY|nr:hypothetical protein PHLCEN_2v5347 [Hermanssonia centrifuga]